MNLIANIERQLRQLDEQHLTRRRRVVDSMCTPRMVVDGQPMLAFCSNDYLGLASHPALIEATAEGARLYGAGSGAAHLVSGHLRAHELLEQRLAEFASPWIDNCRTLTFSTGYMANLAMVTALGLDAEGEIFSESLNHASLIDGARLARAQVKVYPHGDTAALGALLAASTARTKLVATDSVFSMDGNVAPLNELAALCERHGAWLLVDDAHGFGVLGETGRGALEHCRLRSPNIVYMGTFGKAAGVGGAFIAAHASVIEYLIQRARPYIYTTATPPAIAHALLASLDIIGGAEGAERRAHLRALIDAFDGALRCKRWQRGASITAIQPVIIGSNDAALRVAASLYAQGIWVPAIRPPTVPAGTARLRVTLSAAHTLDEVAQLCGALTKLEDALERNEQ